MTLQSVSAKEMCGDVTSTTKPTSELAMRMDKSSPATGPPPPPLTKINQPLIQLSPTNLALQSQCAKPEEKSSLSLSPHSLSSGQFTQSDDSIKKKFGLSLSKLPAFGICCTLVSVVCFSFNSVIVKLLKSKFSMSGIQVLVVRSMFQFVACGLTGLFKRYAFLGVKGTRFNLMCRALSGTVSLCCIFTAFNYVPIGDATTIYFSSPVVVTVFAYFFLDEPFRCVQFTTCFITILGVGFISKPEFIFGKRNNMHYPNQLWGQILSIVAAVTSSITMINLRKLKETPAAVVVFWFSFSIVVFGSCAIYFLDLFKPIDLSDFYCTGLLTSIGFMSILEQYFLTVALRHEDATTISVTRSFNIVLAFMWEVIVFHEQITWSSIVGAILVTLCIFILALSKSCSTIVASITESIGLSQSIDIEQVPEKHPYNSSQNVPIESQTATPSKDKITEKYTQISILDIPNYYL